MPRGAGTLFPAERLKVLLFAWPPPQQAEAASSQHPSPGCGRALHLLSLVWGDPSLLESRQVQKISDMCTQHTNGCTPATCHSCTHRHRHQLFTPAQADTLQTPHAIHTTHHMLHPSCSHITLHQRYTHYKHSTTHTTYYTCYTPHSQMPHTPAIVHHRYTHHIVYRPHTRTHYSHICTIYHIHLIHISYACISMLQHTLTHHNMH